MVKKIAIVPYVLTDFRRIAGKSLFRNPFKKSRCAIFKENLEKTLRAESVYAEVIEDVNLGDLRYLKREKVDIMLIPKEISCYIDYTGIDKADCFLLEEDDYNTGNVQRAVEFIREKNFNT